MIPITYCIYLYSEHTEPDEVTSDEESSAPSLSSECYSSSDAPASEPDSDWEPDVENTNEWEKEQAEIEETDWCVFSM